MSCAWPSRRSSTEKLSNQVMMPCSLTPLTRNMVTGGFERLRLLRNMSWRLLTLSAISFSPYWRIVARIGAGVRRLLVSSWGARPLVSISWAPKGRHSLALFALAVADAEGLQLAVQRRALHADEIGGAGDVAGEAADLDAQILALERLA